MIEHEKIYVDARLPASLLGDESEVRCLTVQEAVLAWHLLPEASRAGARIRIDVKGAKVFGAEEIDRLHYGPAAASAA